jgi:carbonic anhydrase
MLDGARDQLSGATPEDGYCLRPEHKSAPGSRGNHIDRVIAAHPVGSQARDHHREFASTEGVVMSLETLLDRNKAFAATGTVAKNPRIPWLPHQLSYVVTCIDSRVEPAAILGIDLGDATVQRVVGGRVTPAVLRDVAYISYLTETKTPDGPWWELAVIHHTDCGSTLLADPELRRGFAARGGYVEAELAWLPATDPAATVRADVNTLVTAPQLSPNIRISGHVYNTAAGTLDTVVAPTGVGRR